MCLGSVRSVQAQFVHVGGTPEDRDVEAVGQEVGRGAHQEVAACGLAILELAEAATAARGKHGSFGIGAASQNNVVTTPSAGLEP